MPRLARLDARLPAPAAQLTRPPRLRERRLATRPPRLQPRNAGRARSVLAWIAVRIHGYKGVEIAEAFLLSCPTVSRIIEKGEIILLCREICCSLTAIGETDREAIHCRRCRFSQRYFAGMTITRNLRQS